MKTLSGMTSILCLLLIGCTAPAAPAVPTRQPSPPPPTAAIVPTRPPAAINTPNLAPTITLPPPTPTPKPRAVPAFQHIAVLIFENKEFTSTIGNPQMPNFNRLARQYTLLTQHYAIRHPSLPNYLALISGDTQGIQVNCEDCFINAQSLPDLIEASGRTWKTYQEHMPEPCFLGSTRRYAQKHNPFIYFDPIRLNRERCERSIVPLTELDADLAAGTLPDFFFITPDICNSAHDCDLAQSDAWLGEWVDRLTADPDMAQNSLIIVTWDEGQGEHTCCELTTGGGRIATLLISAQARPDFEDETPYTHYSILKTIAAAWDLPELGHAADASTALITAPWKK